MIDIESRELTFDGSHWYKSQTTSESPVGLSDGSPDDAQGGMLEFGVAEQKMLRYGFVDLISCNCMRIGTAQDKPNGIRVCDIEEYMMSEQHRSNMVNQIQSEDMKVERKLYGDARPFSRSIA